MRFTTGCLAILAAVLSPVPGAIAVEVGSCTEFQAVDRKTETEVTITTAEFKCDEYTRLSIRSDMVLKSTVGAVTFSNLALKIYGSLTVEPDVVFTGITNVDRSGGALKVELGAVGVFKGTVAFIDISIIPKDNGIRKFLKGAAIRSKGDLTFEKDTTFAGCLNGQVSGDAVTTGGIPVGRASSGGGGAVYHHVKGTMHFMGKLTMVGNLAYVNFDAGRGQGGAFFNRGDVVVDGEANFTDNRASDGGGIYQERWATFEFNSFATFQDNTAINLLGGAVCNLGGDLACKAGSLFDTNSAASTGDGGNGGAIYNYDGGDITLEGPTAFINNWANYGGGIFNLVEESRPERFEEREGRAYKTPTIIYPDDTVFDDNGANYCPDIAYVYDEETCGL